MLPRGGLDERLDRRHHLVVFQRLADRRGGVAVVDLDDDVVDAVAGVVVARAEHRVPQLRTEEDRADDDHDQRHQREATDERAVYAGRGPSRDPVRLGITRRRGGPTATGSARSRPQSSVIGGLSVPGQGRAPLVQPVLQNLHRRSLIDHRPLSLGADTRIAQRPLCRDRGEPFVGQPHRRRRDAPGQLRRPARSRPIADGPDRSARVRGNPTTTSTASNSSASCASRRRCFPVLCRRSRSHRLHGRGQDPVRIAGGHPDAHGADVDAEPSAASGIVAPGPIRQTVVGIGHQASSGLSLRATRPVPRRYPPPPYRNPAPDRPSRPHDR